MKTRPPVFCSVLAALMILSGCGRAVKYPNYYTLNVPPPPDPPAQGNIHAILAVREFRSPNYLHQGAIVYKASPEQIGFYNYHRWATIRQQREGARLLTGEDALWIFASVSYPSGIDWRLVGMEGPRQVVYFVTQSTQALSLKNLIRIYIGGGSSIEKRDHQILGFPENTVRLLQPEFEQSFFGLRDLMQALRNFRNAK